MRGVGNEVRDFVHVREAASLLDPRIRTLASIAIVLPSTAARVWQTTIKTLVSDIGRHFQGSEFRFEGVCRRRAIRPISSAIRRWPSACGVIAPDMT